MRTRLLLCLGILLLAGCATPRLDTFLAERTGPPRQTEVESVPFYPQKTNLCGPAALGMALVWSGVETTPDALTPIVYTPGREGSLQTEMLTAARRNGRLAYPVDGLTGLFAELDAGRPVVVLQNLGLSWYPQWHYAVAIGYDLESEEIILHSGATPRQRQPLSLFARTWERGNNWGIVVLKPGEMPVQADRDRYINAAIGLERADNPTAARTAYQAALKRWPDNLSALMGLGNSTYALGDLTASADAFRKAVAAHPKAAAAYNNLAQVLFELDYRMEAERAARRAIDLGGPHSETFRETLAEIQRAR